MALIVANHYCTCLGQHSAEGVIRPHQEGDIGF